MDTSVHEISEGIFRLSTHLPDVAGPGGFTMNQFLVDGDEPLLFHCGPRALFPLVSQAASRVVALDRLRWITFGHVEADECGSMNQWLAACPNAQVAHGSVGCDVSVNDLADRPPRVLDDGEVIDIGGHRMRQIPTPHVPHAWEAQLFYDETTGTLFCGDLFTQIGAPPALVHDSDLITAAMAAEEMFHSTSLGVATAPTIRGLADLQPRTLALMHGPSATGGCADALLGLADEYAARITMHPSAA